MGRESSLGPVRQAPNGTMRCYLCMSAPSTQVVKGFGEGLVNVCTFCYNALQATHLEGRHDHRRNDQEF